MRRVYGFFWLPFARLHGISLARTTISRGVHNGLTKPSQANTKSENPQFSRLSGMWNWGFLGWPNPQVTEGRVEHAPDQTHTRGDAAHAAEQQGDEDGDGNEGNEEATLKSYLSRRRRSLLETLNSCPPPPARDELSARGRRRERIERF